MPLSVRRARVISSGGTMNKRQKLASGGAAARRGGGDEGDSGSGPAAASSSSSSQSSSSQGLWLLKSEPDTHVLSGVDVSYSFDRLEAEKRAAWFGIRNYQARNFLRDRVKVGDRCFFHHSSCAEPAIVGVCRVVRGAYPDKDALKPGHPYYDPAHSEEAPRWYQVRAGCSNASRDDIVGARQGGFHFARLRLQRAPQYVGALSIGITLRAPALDILCHPAAPHHTIPPFITLPD
jgi:predicted RNA-binding protein with PUA-like domain